MKPLALLATGTAAACALLAPAGAAAAPAPAAAPEAAAPAQAAPAAEGAAAARRCKITLSSSAQQLVAGEAATLTGALECPLAEEAERQQVTIMQHASGTPGYALAGSATSEAGGAFHVSLPTGVDANSVFYARAYRARSRLARIRVRPAVTISGPAAGADLLPVGPRSDAAVRSARAVSFTGTVSPTGAATTVVLQRERAATETWLQIGVAHVSATGQYAISHNFSLPGPATLRVVVHARGMLAVASEALSYRVARQDARLTISSAAAELIAGEPVTITGVSAAGAGVALTLLARTPGRRFTAVASVRSASAGRYQFPAQTPSQTTYYRVRGGGASSVALREGVRPALTAEAPAGPVSAGQTVSFCGTLAAARAGEAVSQQQADPAGLLFHDVAEATLAGGSSFCVQFEPTAAGSETYRVEVPRTSEQDAAASEGFHLDVMAAGAAGLISPPPGEAEAVS